MTTRRRIRLAWRAARGRLAVAALLALAATAGLLPMTAHAVPSYARQTGSECAACHVGGFGPQLTPYGVRFKINGYTDSDGKDGKIPLSAMMVGFVSGGLLSLVWRPRRILLVGELFLMLTVCFPLAMAWSTSLWLVLAGAFLHGFGLEIFSVGWDLAIQENVPEHLLARVYSFDQLGSFLARPIGLALTGPLAAAVGNREWLVVVAVAMLVAEVVPFAVPEVRRLERRPAAEEQPVG